MLSIRTILVATAALAGLASAESYFLKAEYTSSSGGLVSAGWVWYGDGQVYAGAIVPPEVNVAFNFTVPNQRADFLYISPNATGATLPDPTILVANDTSGATAPLYFTNSGLDFTDSDILFWTRVETIFAGVQESGNVLASFYLDSTSVADTYVLKWKNADATAIPTGTGLAGKAVSLYWQSS